LETNVEQTASNCTNTNNAEAGVENNNITSNNSTSDISMDENASNYSNDKVRFNLIIQ